MVLLSGNLCGVVLKSKIDLKSYSSCRINMSQREREREKEEEKMYH